MRFLGFIYKYVSPSGKIYIGKTNNEARRRAQHKSSAYCGDNTYFHLAIRKYGFDNFEYETVIQVSASTADKLDTILNTLEKFYIKKYNSNNREFGYNLTAGGEGVSGLSEEIRTKISIANKGKTICVESRKKISESLKQLYLEGYRPGNSVTIVAFKNGEFYKEYFSTMDAARDLGLKSASSITNVLKGRAKTAKGLTFKYKEDLI